jgi:hypothetical protein
MTVEKIVEPEKFKHYAIVLHGVVVNTVVWDGVTEYNPEGLLVDLTGTDPEPGIGWDYDGKKFVDNRPVEESLYV